MSDRPGNNFNNNPRPSRFSNKRSRSRSPPARTSRFDTNSYGTDYKRPRTDNSRPSQVSLSRTFSLFYIKFKFRMNLLDILMHHQSMVMVCNPNDHIKDLNQMQ
jgi:hypothetical protein